MLKRDSGLHGVGADNVRELIADVGHIARQIVRKTAIIGDDWEDR